MIWIPRDVTSYVEANDFRERALLARVEITSFLRNATEIHSIGTADERAWWFMHRWMRIPSGFVEGVHAASTDPLQSEWVPTWTHDVLREPGVKIAKIIAAKPADDLHDTGSQIWFDDTRACMRFSTRLEDVLPLAETYEATLARLGKHTRRNVRIVRKQAAAAGIVFSPVERMTPQIWNEVLALRANAYPHPPPVHRINRYEAFINAGDRGFRSVLRDANGRLLSYAAGTNRKGVAYLVYQLNDHRWFGISPSLLHRAHIIEHFISQGAVELVFVHGCVGTLRHACTPIFGDEIWLIQRNGSSRLLSALMANFFPSGGLTAMARHNLRQFALGKLIAA